MRTQENLLTIEQFVPGWQHTHPRIRIDGIISTFKETHRLTDEWLYHLDPVGIYIKILQNGTGRSDKIYVRDLISRTGYPNEAEAKVFDKLESWAKEAEEGTAVWVSPPFPEKYPCGKIIVHQINYELATGEKVVRNSAILFDAGERETLETLHQLFPQTREIQRLEELRDVLLLPGRDFNPALLAEAIAKLDKNVRGARRPISPEGLERRARYISNLISSGANGRQVAYEMQGLGLLGKFSLSCPTAQRKGVPFSETIGGIDRYGSLQFKCHVCGFENTRPYGRLIPNCHNCGANVRC